MSRQYKDMERSFSRYDNINKSQDMSNTNPINEQQQPDQYRVRAERDIKLTQDDQVKDVKNQYETRLSSMREDIYRKEREIYDIKNQLNLINLRIDKEMEAHEGAELNLRKNNENFNIDTSKLVHNLRTTEKENEYLRAKLAETEKVVQDSTLDRKATENRLDNTSVDQEELMKRFELENEDKNRRINSLHAELKELQDRLNEQTAKNSYLNGKNEDLSGNYDRVNYENSENISRLKVEQDRLYRDNEDLHIKVSHLGKEVEVEKNQLDRSAYDKQQQRSAFDHELARINEQLRDGAILNNSLDGELKMAFKLKQEFDSKAKEEKNELDHRIRETAYILERANSENVTIRQKLAETEAQQTQVQRENERILLDFEETKQTSQNQNNQKENEINMLKTQNYSLDSQIRESNDRIVSLESGIAEGSKRYADMRDSLNADVNAVIGRHGVLKTNFDDTCLELRHRAEQLREVQVKTENLTNRFRYNSDLLTSEKARTSEENIQKANHMDALRRDYSSLNDGIANTQIILRGLESDISDLKRKNESTVSDNTSLMRRLEESNYSLTLDKDNLSNKLWSSTAECANLKSALDDYKNDAFRKESDMNDKINQEQKELNSEREAMRNLATENNKVVKDQEDSLRIKEGQHHSIKSIRESILELEQNIRQAHDQQVNRDVQDLLDLTASHSINRQEHINAIKDIIELLSNNVDIVGSAEDLKQIEESLGLYKRNIEDDENEVRGKDAKVAQAISENLQTRLEVDRTRKARSDQEAEMKKMEETRVAQDGLWIENHKLNGENQGLQTNLVQVSADLREANERRNAVAEASPKKQLGSPVRFSGGMANALTPGRQDTGLGSSGKPKFRSQSRFDRSGYKTNQY